MRPKGESPGQGLEGKTNLENVFAELNPGFGSMMSVKGYRLIALVVTRYLFENFHRWVGGNFEFGAVPVKRVLGLA